MVPSFLVLGVALVWAWRAHLGRFSGTRFRSRLQYSLLLSGGFTALFLLDPVFQHGNAGIGLLLGAALSMPSIAFSRFWLAGHIQGSVVYYKRHQQWRNAVLGLAIVVVAAVTGGDESLLRKFPWFGLVVSVPWFASSVYQLAYVAWQEQQDGKIIMEEQR